MGKRKGALGALSALALCLALAPAAAFADEAPDFDDGTWTALTDETTEIDGAAGARYYLADDVTINETLRVEGGTEESPVVLDLNGYVLRKTGDGGAVRVEAGAHLVLRDSRPDAETGYSYSMDEYDAPVLHAPDDEAPEDATEIVGGIIAGGNASASGSATGGGVHVEAGGSFAMEGGSISNCKASGGRGGGVFVGTDFPFTMEGDASITGCEADKAGPHVYNQGTISSGTFRCMVASSANIGNPHSETCGSISGGAFYGAVDNDGGSISGGAFYGAVKNRVGNWGAFSYGSISGGAFYGAVKNRVGNWGAFSYGSISGGAFYGAVDNEGGLITGGAFYGAVDNEGGLITGGTFYGDLPTDGTVSDERRSVTFDFGYDGADPAATTTATATVVGEAGPVPPAPQREGWKVDGWYKDEECTAPWDPASVANDATLYAKWVCAGHKDEGRDHECDVCGAAVGEHGGGGATCVQGAVCGYCGEECGEPDPSAHGDVEHVAAKAATERSEGNVEYWCCLDCGKCYVDEALTREVPPSDVVLPRLEPAPAAVLAETGDVAPAAAGAAAALALAGGAAALLARRRCA